MADVEHVLVHLTNGKILHYVGSAQLPEGEVFEVKEIKLVRFVSDFNFHKYLSSIPLNPLIQSSSETLSPSRWLSNAPKSSDCNPSKGDDRLGYEHAPAAPAPPTPMPPSPSKSKSILVKRPVSLLDEDEDD